MTKTLYKILSVTKSLKEVFRFTTRIILKCPLASDTRVESKLSNTIPKSPGNV